MAKITVHSPIRYIAHARVLNRRVGEEFESTDPAYLAFAAQGYLTVLEDEEVDNGSSGSPTGGASGGSD